MVNELEYKYEVEVEQSGGRQRIPSDTKAELKASGMIDDKGKLKIKGVSPKMLQKMKAERVECPVLRREVHFVKCFVCPNFQSRVMGKVLCRGDPL